MIEIIKTVLTVLGTVIGAWLLYKGQKFVTRSSAKATATTREQAWNDDYRSGAERHMYWDVKMVAAVRQAQDAVHALEDRLGMDRTVFETIADPPPLFPSRTRAGHD